MQNCAGFSVRAVVAIVVTGLPGALIAQGPFSSSSSLIASLSRPLPELVKIIGALGDGERFGAKEPQTIDFPAIGAQDALTTVTLSATASSGLPVTFSSNTPTICTVSGDTATLLAGGYCTVYASQTGNSDYSAAPLVGHQIQVLHAPQTITFPAIASQPVLSTVALSATASSGLTVSFASLTPSVCTVTSSSASLVEHGTCTIKSSQVGNTVYASAPSVSNSFTVTGLAQTITFPAIPAQDALTSVALSATASSGLPVAFASMTPSVCTVSGATASLHVAAYCTVKASQPGNSVYAAAPTVSQNIEVLRIPQTITFPAITGNQYVGDMVTLNATASSGLPVTYTSIYPSACTVSGSTASLIAVGDCSIRATQPGNGDYSAAPNAIVSFEVQTNSNVTVSVSPQNSAVVTGQALNVVATTNDSTGVNWSASGASCSGSACGTFSSASTLSGVATTWTAPSAAGVYTLKAASASNGTTSASVTVGVTDLTGIGTVHYDLYRDGANTKEYVLTPSFVTSGNFGKLFSCTVDGAIYAEPLWVPQLTIGGAKHNVVFVATQHDSLYAFDADTNSSPCAPLWKVSLIDTAHGGQSGETPVLSYGPNALVGGGGDIAPEVGVTGTPVIDLSTNPSTPTLYVVSKSVDSTQTNFYQRLHAIDVTSGSEKFSGPATIAGTYPGTGDGGSTTTFVAQQQNQRPGLALANGTVYISWSSHEDNPPYYGWVMGYNAATLARKYVLNVTPNVRWGGIWMNGDAPAVDADGNLYLLTGNGTFDGDSLSAPNNDFGDSVLKLEPALNESLYFTPSDQLMDDQDDNDLGSGGATLIDLPANGNNPTQLVAGGGKDGYIYLLDRTNLGGLGDANAWQRMNWGAGIFASVAYWNNTLYMSGIYGDMQAFALDPQKAMIYPTTPISSSSTYFQFPGSSPVVSSMPDNSNGIVWALDQTNYCTPQSPGCGPVVLHAYQAGDLGNELWNSSTNSADTAGFPVKFTLPTVANGHVYIGTRGNNTGGAENSTSIPGELDVYGPLN
ncbi:MAG: hypothetical protein WAL75_25850 [Terracidiphilus sp.]